MVEITVNSLVESGILSELTCGKNLTYILNNDSGFSATNYKILQGYDQNCFVKCMKMKFNGKTQLFYVTGRYKSLSGIIAQLDSNSFINVISNLFQSIDEVKQNGFLTCANIDITSDHIYVDPNTLKVFLIYVPTFEGFFADDNEFENDFRTNIIKLIVSNPILGSQEINKLFSNLQNVVLPFAHMLDGVTNANNSTQRKAEELPIKESVVRPFMKLISINTATTFSINVDKVEFVLGRSKKAADGIIPDNKMVGREHCRLQWDGEKYTVEDLKSANGTYLNKMRLKPGIKMTIVNGDILRLANLDVKIVIEG